MTSGHSDTSPATVAQPDVRPLEAADLDRCVAIDRVHAGRSRRGFFETRLQAALKAPKDFIYVGATVGGELAGFALVRLLEGEYGATAPVGVLDAIGVEKGHLGSGLGQKLMRGVEDVMRGKGIVELRSQLDWRNHGLMRFLERAGFALAPRLVLYRPVAEPADFDTRLIALENLEFSPGGITPGSDAGVPDYSDPGGDDFDALSRDVVPVRSMVAGDLPALARIDRKIVGRDRTAYFTAKGEEVLKESGIRVSLVAELDGAPVGFVMARLDFGEYGHVEPEAVIDTMGIDPAFAHHHVGSALMSQLLANLAALRVEYARTQVLWDATDLLSFLAHCGFRPSQRIALVREVGTA
jgi:GNAT superfamily N-acetyltransferase